MPTQYERGLIWMFPGVEGGARSMASAVKGFRDAGVESAIEIHDWERPFGLIRNLTEQVRNRRDAKEIASRIDRYVEEYPNNSVDLWGFSGGGGLAIMVAEALADEVRIRNIVLIHPGISPRYDLTRALLHVDGKMVNFHSVLDGLVLGVVTTVLGTMDRVHGPSAGWLGFEESAAVPDRRLRGKLVQRPWSLDMVPAGHWGGHLSGRSYRWNKTIVAPYLTTTNENSSTDGF